jgi:hypothetical protein
LGMNSDAGVPCQTGGIGIARPRWNPLARRRGTQQSAARPAPAILAVTPAASEPPSSPDWHVHVPILHDGAAWGCRREVVCPRNCWSQQKITPPPTFDQPTGHVSSVGPIRPAARSWCQSALPGPSVMPFSTPPRRGRVVAPIRWRGTGTHPLRRRRLDRESVIRDEGPIQVPVLPHLVARIQQLRRD